MCHVNHFQQRHPGAPGEGAIKAIENTVPSATPSTEIKDVVIDQVKGAVVDKMVDSAKKDDKPGPNQPKPPQPNPNQQPSVKPNDKLPMPPSPTPPSPPPCALDKNKKC